MSTPSSATDLSNLGSALHDLIQRTGLSLRQVADRAGVPPATLVRIKRHDRYGSTPKATWDSIIYTLAYYLADTGETYETIERQLRKAYEADREV